MTSTQKLFSIIATAFAVWFCLTSYMWTYLAALLVSYPFGLLSLMIWYLLKRKGVTGNLMRLIPKMLVFGCVLSVVVLIGFLITN